MIFDRLRVHPPYLINLPNRPMKPRIVWLHYQQTLKVIQGFVILPTEVKDSSDGSIDEAVVRGKLFRSFYLRHCFVKASPPHQKTSLCHVNFSDTRIKF